MPSDEQARAAKAGPGCVDACRLGKPPRPLSSVCFEPNSCVCTCMREPTLGCLVP